MNDINNEAISNVIQENIDMRDHIADAYSAIFEKDPNVDIPTNNEGALDDENLPQTIRNIKTFLGDLTSGDGQKIFAERGILGGNGNNDLDRIKSNNGIYFLKKEESYSNLPIAALENNNIYCLQIIKIKDTEETLQRFFIINDIQIEVYERIYQSSNWGGWKRSTKENISNKDEYNSEDEDYKGISDNNDRYPSSKAVREALDIKEDTDNKDTYNSEDKKYRGISDNDTHYPSSLAVQSVIKRIDDNIEDIYNKKATYLDPFSDEKYPTTKAVSDALDDKENISNKVNSLTTSSDDKYPTTKAVNDALNTKVNEIKGKGLSTNDFTNEDKTKLNGIEAGANNTIVDSKLLDTSENPVQNKVIQNALKDKEDKGNKDNYNYEDEDYKGISDKESKYPSSLAVREALKNKEDKKNKDEYTYEDNDYKGISNNESKYPSSKSVREILERINQNIENIYNKKVTSFDEPLDETYPTTKAVSDALDNKENISNKVTSLDNPSNETYPTTKAVSNAIYREEVDNVENQGLLRYTNITTPILDENGEDTGEKQYTISFLDMIDGSYIALNGTDMSNFLNNDENNDKINNEIKEYSFDSRFLYILKKIKLTNRWKQYTLLNAYYGNILFVGYVNQRNSGSSLWNAFTDKTLTKENISADAKAVKDALDTKEDKNKKVTSLDIPSDETYPTTQAVSDALDNKADKEDLVGIDTTLSIEGKAADAKTVGDFINEVNDILQEKENISYEEKRYENYDIKGNISIVTSNIGDNLGDFVSTSKSTNYRYFSFTSIPYDNIKNIKLKLNLENYGYNCDWTCYSYKSIKANSLSQEGYKTHSNTNNKFIEGNKPIYLNKESDDNYFCISFRFEKRNEEGDNILQEHKDAVTQALKIFISQEKNNISSNIEGYLSASGDRADRSLDIQNMLDTVGCCTLGPGKFYIEDGIELPKKGMIKGQGNSTKLIRTGFSSGENYILKLNSMCSVSDMQILDLEPLIVGSTTYNLSDIEISDTNKYFIAYSDDNTAITGLTRPRKKQYANIGDNSGILIEGTYNNSTDTKEKPILCSLSNLFISSIPGCGIKLNQIGMSPISHTQIINCNITYCDCGIYDGTYSEFNLHSNIACNYNYYGVIVKGGNNKFSNCDFSNNAIGIFLDCKNEANNAHGFFVGCEIAHSFSSVTTTNASGDKTTYLDWTKSNQGIAIKCDGVNNSEIFNNCQIGYGQIEIKDSNGVKFHNCAIGRPIKNGNELIGNDIYFDSSNKCLLNSCSIGENIQINAENSNNLNIMNCILSENVKITTTNSNYTSIMNCIALDNIIMPNENVNIVNCFKEGELYPWSE